MIDLDFDGERRQQINDQLVAAAVAIVPSIAIVTLAGQVGEHDS